MTLFDVDALRREFPALAIVEGGRPMAYFDGPGGTQVPRAVVEAVARYYETSNANDGGAFPTSARSDAVVADAHRALADLLNARSADEIKTGANMTSLTFHLSRSIGAILRPGDEVVVTTLDHEANVAPWRAMAADRGLVVRTVDIHPEDGTLDIDHLDRSLTERTRLVAVGSASNALGTINPVAEIVRKAHAVGALAYVDAVHLAPHALIDVQALDADFLVCSAYKFFGPHVGVVYGKAEVLDRLPAEAYKVRPAHDRFETGTQNFEGLAGTGAAIEYLAGIGRRHGEPAGSAPADGAAAAAVSTARAEIAMAWTERRRALEIAMAAIRDYEMTLFERLLDGLGSIQGVRLWGITERSRLRAERAPTAAITFVDHEPRQVAEALGRQAIATWDGDFYARGLVERLGIADRGGLLRMGIVHYNTAAEVDRLLAAIDGIVGA